MGGGATNCCNVATSSFVEVIWFCYNTHKSSFSLPTQNNTSSHTLQGKGRPLFTVQIKVKIWNQSILIFEEQPFFME